MDKEEAKKIVEKLAEKELLNVIKEHMLRLRPCRLGLLDLSKVPVENLRERYRDYGIFQGCCGIIEPFKQISEDIEGNRISEDAKTVAQNLGRKYLLDRSWQIIVDDGDNDVPILVAIADIKENSKMVIDDMAMAGYFVGYRKEYQKDGMLWQVLQFEPLYPKDNTDEVKKGTIAYHWTPSYNLGDITKNGLVPKSENSHFSYPPRVYIMTRKCDYNRLMALGQTLCLMNKDPRNNGKYALISLRTWKIPKETKFYYDPNMTDAMYTYDVIPPSAILNIEKHKFQTDAGIKQENSEE